jgi:hypothetical protein
VKCSEVEITTPIGGGLATDRPVERVYAGVRLVADALHLREPIGAA